MLYQKDVIHVDLLCQAIYIELMLGKKVKIRKSGGTISRTLCEYLTHTHKRLYAWHVYVITLTAVDDTSVAASWKIFIEMVGRLIN